VTSVTLILNNTFAVYFAPQRCKISEVYCRRGNLVWRGEHNGCNLVSCIVPTSSVPGTSSLEISFDGLHFSNSGFTANLALPNGVVEQTNSSSASMEHIQSLSLISLHPKSFFCIFFQDNSDNPHKF